jgi:anti-sigma factor RsiW
MRCKNVLDRLDDHVDGILPSPVSEAIRDHLDACQDCRETALALRASSNSLQSWDDIEPPDGCFDRILARVDALPPEALERGMPRARLTRLAQLAQLESVNAARMRWMATSGLAAAAAVMGGLLISQPDVRPIRRARQEPVAEAVTTSATWFQGYDFDDGLLYRGSPPPALQPLGVPEVELGRPR